MNKEEIKFDHFKDIEELIQHLEMWYAEDDYYAYDRYFHLRDARIMGMFIYELQQENQQLKELINGIREERDYLFNKSSVENKQIQQEKDLYKSVIEEVREYGKNCLRNMKRDTNEFSILAKQIHINYFQILDKVKEVK